MSIPTSAASTASEGDPSSNARLLILANRAPLRKTSDGWSPSVGGLATALLPVLERQGGVWISIDDEGDLPERQPFPPQDPRFTVHRVPLSDEEMHNYYHGMANAVLWPVAHYMLHHLELDAANIEDYSVLNSLFAEAALDEYEPGDHIWVHDYHLMLAPTYIREQQPEASVALFWHIPWPAMEVLRIVPWARELIRGLLGCDLIGFHVEDYVENFLEGARVLLGAEVQGNVIHWEGRQIRIEAHPIGIDVSRFERITAAPEMSQRVKMLRDEIGAERLIVGVDRLDYTKGILERLLAFELLLQEFPEYRGWVSLIQVATPSRTEVTSYQQLKREVDEAVGRINGAFGRADWLPVHYRYRTFSQEELCVYYRAADVGLITPLRDGMNLVAQEFVTASADGVLVLSELAGAAYLLPETVQVNPFDMPGVVNALREALEMSTAHRLARLTKLKARVRSLDVHPWAATFLESMTKT